MEEHCQMEYIMSFLMGLNDSFEQVRGSSIETSTAASLTESQCQKLISMLSTQLANSTTIQDPTSAQGQIMFDEDWQG
ncbi:hypothetical protein SESBI_17259 [Sesbania bispinosa]|nr:hypothetical protein SESBI_17259 [Sesbania bispinosa]